MPKEFSNKFLKELNIAIAGVSLIETSNLKTFYWTISTMSRSLTSDSLLAYRMRRRLRCFAGLLLTWLQK
jgi:hypothetical protein